MFLPLERPRSPQGTNMLQCFLLHLPWSSLSFDKSWSHGNKRHNKLDDVVVVGGSAFGLP